MKDAIMLAAPGSPPELTGSKSSKSSSFHSSSHDRDVVFPNLSDFEEIGLDDHHISRKQHPADQYSTSYPPKLDARQNVSKRPLARVPMQGNRTPAIGTMRDLTSQKRPGYQQRLQSNGVLNDHTRLGVAPSYVMRRGFTSTSTPSLRMTMAKKQQSRSPSPPFSNSKSTSHSLPNDRPRLRQTPSPTLKPTSRRASWQPSKKSVEELEEECHDSDEDVPDDAVIWNVPISPRPPHERAASASASPSTSPGQSPPRSSNRQAMPTSSYASMVPSDDRSNPLRSPLPRSPSKPNFNRGSSMGSFPSSNISEFPKIRAKSWTAALSELSEEAKSLTEALEVHAELEGHEHGTAVKNGARKSLISEKPRSDSSIIELPPIRKTNIMIDPLPISKEKEAVLSRTRPSWLPPKSQKEERKHLKEYQKMMLLSQEAERKRLEVAAHEAEALEAQRTSLARIWDEHVIPNWSRAVSEPRTRELWWRGISPQSRGQVWSRAIGNDLSLTAASFNTALSRARVIESSVLINEDAGISDSRSEKEGAWYRSIGRDALGAWPATNLFGQASPLHDSLIDVCMAYAAYRSDVGYIHGTHLIASLLLLNLPSPADAFVSLANLLNRPLPLSFLTADPSGCARAYSLTLQTLEYKHPHLYTHLFETLRLDPGEILEAMFRTLFCVGTGNTIGLEEVSNIWDVFVFEGDKALIRAAVAVMSCIENKVLGREKAEIRKLFGWTGQGNTGIGVEEFMKQFREAGKEERGRSPAPVDPR